MSLSENKIEELAQKIYESLDESVQLNILAQENLRLEVEYEDQFDDEEMSDAELEKIGNRVYELVKENNPPRCYIKLDDWHLIFREYMVFGDLENDQALYDNLDAFGIIPEWCRCNKKCYQLSGHEPLGIMFLKIPKWWDDEAAAALDNYLNRMEWEHHGFKELAQSVMADLMMDE